MLSSSGRRGFALYKQLFNSLKWCGHSLKCCIIDEPCSEEKRILYFGSHCSLAGVLCKEISGFSFTANLDNLGKGSVAVSSQVGGQTLEVSKPKQSAHFEGLASKALYIALDMLNAELLLSLIVAVVFLQQ